MKKQYQGTKWPRPGGKEPKERTIVLTCRSVATNKHLRQKLRAGTVVLVDGVPLFEIVQFLAVDVPEAEKLLGRVVVKSGGISKYEPQ